MPSLNLSISDKVDLNFRLVSSREDADIVFYYDTEIDLSLEDDSTTFGLTVSNYDFLTGRRWVEIFLNAPALNLSSPDFQSYVFNHELMHALGLEHPFDGSDGDYYLSTDFNKSAFPTDTVMSYRMPRSGVYPTDLSSSDYHALSQI